jgi:hypothetical protein
MDLFVLKTEDDYPLSKMFVTRNHLDFGLFHIMEYLYLYNEMS